MKRRATFIESIFLDGPFGLECQWLTFEGVMLRGQHPLSTSQVVDLIAAALWPTRHIYRIPDRPSLAEGDWQFCLDVTIAGSRYRLLYDLTERSSRLSLEDEPEREDILGREAIEAFLSARMIVPEPPPRGSSETEQLRWLTQVGLLVLEERIHPAGRDRYVPLRLLHCDPFTRTDLAFDLRLQRHVRLRALREPWTRYPKAVEAFLGCGHQQARAGGHFLPLHELDSDREGAWHVLAKGPKTRADLGDTDWSDLCDKDLAAVLKGCAKLMSDCEIVHGRIEPQSILLHRGNAVLFDTGIADAVLRAAPEDARHMAPASAWSAPEVLSGAAPSVSSDMYSLGLIFKSILVSLPSTMAQGDWFFMSIHEALENMIQEKPSKRPKEWSYLCFF